MKKLTFKKIDTGAYNADNDLHTRRYSVQKVGPAKWMLQVWPIEAIHFASDDSYLYLADTKYGTDFTDYYETKWEAVSEANIWEATKIGDTDAKVRFHNEKVDRWIGEDVSAELASELRDRLYK